MYDSINPSKQTKSLPSFSQYETNDNMTVTNSSQPDFTTSNPPLLDVPEDGSLPVADAQDLTVCQPFNRMWLENMEFDTNEPLTEEQTYEAEFQPDLNPYEDLEPLQETMREYDGGDLGLDSTHPLNDILTKHNKEINEMLEKKEKNKKKNEIITKKEEEEEEEMDDGNINKKLNKSLFSPSMKRLITPEKARKKEKEFLEAQKERLDKRIIMKEIKAKKIEENQIKQQQPPPTIPSKIIKQKTPNRINESKISETKTPDTNSKVPHKVTQSKERTPSAKGKDTPKAVIVARRKQSLNNNNEVKENNNNNNNGDVKGFLYKKQVQKAVVPAYKAPQKPSNKKIIKLAINNICLPVGLHKEENAKVINEINTSTCNRYCIVIKENKGYKSLYGMNEENDKGLKLHGIGPNIIEVDMVQHYFKYNSVQKKFEKLEVSNFTSTVDAVMLLPSC